MKKRSGFTLIELVIFILLIGIITSMLIACYLTILKRSPIINQQIDAPHIAAKCADWYLGQRFINNFSSSSLTCNNTTTPAYCNANLPSGYSVTANVSCATLYGDATNYKTITVNVTGLSQATLSTIIANY